MENHISRRRVIGFLYTMVRPFAYALFVMISFALIWAINLSMRPYLFKLILNDVAEKTTDTLVNAVTPIIMFYLAWSVLMFLCMRMYGYFVEVTMIPALRKRIILLNFDNLLGQDHRYYQDNFAGNLSNKVNDLANGVPDILQITFDVFLCYSLTLGVALYTISQVNWIFFCIISGWITLFLLGSLSFSSQLIVRADRWSEYISTITGSIVDVLANILSVRLFTRKTIERDALAITCDNAVNAERTLQWSYFILKACFGVSFITVQAISFYFLVQGRVAGTITVGDFSLVLAMNITVLDALWRITLAYSQFSTSFGRITQALRALNVVPTLQDLPQALPLKVSKGEIVFENVTFTYQGAPILFANKSLIIPAGQKVGLVGYSGSGKSTFVHLILRLFDLNEGRILIDGQDIKTVTQDSLHAAIGIVPQDVSLFHRTLLENMTYSSATTTQEGILSAATKARVDEFVKHLAQGYNTQAGESGLKISIGQSQRIALARVFLKNAPILILDDATSQLDALTEQAITDALDELMQNKTAIVIANRLATLRRMDRILVFDQGKIVEDGTSKELLERGGLYKKMWDAQVGGLLPEKNGY